jgi:hypothetical protein
MIRPRRADRVTIPPHFGRRSILRSVQPQHSAPSFRSSHLPIHQSNPLLSSPSTTMVHPQVNAQLASLRDPDSFWLPLATKLIDWIKPPTKALVTNQSKWSWFPDGTLNTCYNCVDRHPPSRIAIEYISPVAKAKESITYGQLAERVESVAAVLQIELGVRKGDTVIIYSLITPLRAKLMG